MPTVREASCSCGQLRASVTGDPIRVSICHCLACQRRTGSPFGEQARLDAANVVTSGRANTWSRVPDGGGAPAEFSFCPECGSTVFYRFADAPEVIVIPVGAFADPRFPAPTRSVWEDRRHSWVVVPPGAERLR